MRGPAGARSREPSVCVHLVLTGVPRGHVGCRSLAPTGVFRPWESANVRETPVHRGEEPRVKNLLPCACSQGPALGGPRRRVGSFLRPPALGRPQTPFSSQSRTRPRDAQPGLALPARSRSSALARGSSPECGALEGRFPVLAITKRAAVNAGV